MKFDRKFFEMVFNDHPELLALFSQDIVSTHDYQISDESTPWMTDMYQAADMALSFLDPNDFTNPLSQVFSSIIYSNLSPRSIELERTMLSIMAMYALVDRDYLFFRNTPVLSGGPISKLQFTMMSQLYSQCSEALRVCKVVLNGLGKIKPLRKALGAQFAIDEINQQDPNEFMNYLFTIPYDKLATVLPSIKNLSKESMIKFQQTNACFHYGHFFHAECTETKLKELQFFIEEVKETNSLNTHIFAQLLIVAGSAAHENGKIALNRSTCFIYLEDMLPALSSLSTEAAENVYNDYIDKRLGAFNMDSSHTEYHLSARRLLLGRLCCLFRIQNEDDAKQLFGALNFLLLTNKSFNEHIKILNDYQAEPNNPTPTYMPALFHALRTSPRIMELAERAETDALIVTLRVGCKLIGDLLKMYPKNSQIPMSFNQTAGAVKSDFDHILEMLGKTPKKEAPIVNQLELYKQTHYEEQKVKSAIHSAENSDAENESDGFKKSDGSEESDDSERWKTKNSSVVI